MVNMLCKTSMPMTPGNPSTPHTVSENDVTPSVTPVSTLDTLTAARAHTPCNALVLSEEIGFPDLNAAISTTSKITPPKTVYHITAVIPL